MTRLILFAIIMAVGQLLFKKASEAVPSTPTVANLTGLALNPYLLTALTLYFAATLLWVWVLRDIPLTRAYPFIALGFVLVPLGSMVVFQEPLSLRYALGTLLIIGGIWLSATPQN